MIATKPVDFRKGWTCCAGDRGDGTRSILRHGLCVPGETNRPKLIFWDGTGMCLVAKRLQEGDFRWPKMQAGLMHLTAAQFSALFEGPDWKRVHVRAPARVPVTPAKDRDQSGALAHCTHAPEYAL
ncbi:IS66 family insertion sequence element accessory protein TnpB [Rhizobium sp. P32RR-XVIII]|uniref:IS66 family insertion sequence element accessory protein TnpB n=1 Tax=Rhizobium sp. P32RR-XVIII TaxID=2726738 RepID=UPI0014570A98|nr:IS66 family insertion sequence element accessory protein TnpB [Rhizobium sp. P32RR-XVIII]NLS07290.1 IS66 family insertion sequence element accessory protein TnpB [Rhizobium sp. P32RR-XVIII]